MLSELLTAKRVHRQTHRPPPVMLVAGSVLLLGHCFVAVVVGKARF